MGSSALVVGKVLAELRRRVGVPAAPCLVVDDLARRAVVGVDVGDDAVDRLQLRVGVSLAAPHVDHLDADRVGVHAVVGRRGGRRAAGAAAVVAPVLLDPVLAVVAGVAVACVVGDLVEWDALHHAAVAVDDEVGGDAVAAVRPGAHRRRSVGVHLGVVQHYVALLSRRLVSVLELGVGVVLGEVEPGLRLRGGGGRPREGAREQVSDPSRRRRRGALEVGSAVDRLRDALRPLRVAARRARVRMPGAVPAVPVDDELDDDPAVHVAPLVAPGVRLVLLIAHDRLDDGAVLLVEVYVVADLAECRRAGDHVAPVDLCEPLVVEGHARLLAQPVLRAVGGGDELPSHVRVDVPEAGGEVDRAAGEGPASGRAAGEPAGRGSRARRVRVVVACPGVVAVLLDLPRRVALDGRDLVAPCVVLGDHADVAAPAALPYDEVAGLRLVGLRVLEGARLRVVAVEVDPSGDRRVLRGVPRLREAGLVGHVGREARAPWDARAEPYPAPVLLAVGPVGVGVELGLRRGCDAACGGGAEAAPHRKDAPAEHEGDRRDPCAARGPFAHPARHWPLPLPNSGRSQSSTSTFTHVSLLPAWRMNLPRGALESWCMVSGVALSRDWTYWALFGSGLVRLPSALEKKR